MQVQITKQEWNPTLHTLWAEFTGQLFNIDSVLFTMCMYITLRAI